MLLKFKNAPLIVFILFIFNNIFFHKSVSGQRKLGNMVNAQQARIPVFNYLFSLCKI